MLPYRNDLGARGWLDPEHARGGNMPHNWTSAEMITCLRDMFVCERDGKLVLGLGAPQSWREPGNSYGVRGLPTDMGAVSYTVTWGSDGKPSVDYDGPEGWVLHTP